MLSKDHLTKIILAIFLYFFELRGEREEVGGESGE